MRIDYTPEQIAEAIVAAPLLVAYQERFDAAFDVHYARIVAEQAELQAEAEKSMDGSYTPISVATEATKAALEEIGPSPYPQWFQRPAVFVVALASLLTPDGQKERP